MQQNPYYEKQLETTRRRREEHNRYILQKHRKRKSIGSSIKRILQIILLTIFFASEFIPRLRSIVPPISPHSEKIVRNVPYREIDLSALSIISDSDVSDSILQNIREATELMLCNTYLKRHFIGNCWHIYVTNQPLPETNGIKPAGITDTGERQISLLSSQVDRSIYHEFGHYFMAMYIYNFPDAESRLNELYAEENSVFQSYTGSEADSLYGKSNVHEFIASVFDNMVHDHQNICPKTEAYLEQLYQTLSQMDYAEVYSTDYHYHKSFEELLENYGPSYTILIDGTPIDPITYDIHDLPDAGYETSIHDLGGHGTVFVTSHSA